MEKARVAPIKFVTIPRTELVAATYQSRFHHYCPKNSNSLMLRKQLGQTVKLFLDISDINQ